MAPDDGLGTVSKRQPGMVATDKGQGLVRKTQDKAKSDASRSLVKEKLGQGATLVSVAEALHIFDGDEYAGEVKRILNATAADELSNIEQWIVDALAPGNDYNIEYLCAEISPDTIKNVERVTFTQILVGKELRITVTPEWK